MVTAHLKEEPARKFQESLSAELPGVISTDHAIHEGDRVLQEQTAAALGKEPSEIKSTRPTFHEALNLNTGEEEEQKAGSMKIEKVHDFNPEPDHFKVPSLLNKPFQVTKGLLGFGRETEGRNYVKELSRKLKGRGFRLVSNDEKKKQLIDVQGTKQNLQLIKGESEQKETPSLQSAPQLTLIKGAEQPPVTENSSVRPQLQMVAENTPDTEASIQPPNAPEPLPVSASQNLQQAA